MRYGVCASFDQILDAQAGGLDYIEVGAAWIAGLDSAGIRNVCSVCQTNGIWVRAANCLFPGDIRLNGKDYSLDKVREYVKVVFDKAAHIGVETISLGSGGQRKIGSDDDRESCIKQFAEAADTIGHEAMKAGVIVAIEPLNKWETNLINTVAEGAEMVRQIANPNLLLLADTYHMFLEKENFDVIAENKDIISHIHVANPNGRVFPKKGDGIDYLPVAEAIKKAGYDNKISLEAGTDDFIPGCRETGAYLRELFG